jgi:hypothetical protein
MWWVMIFSPGWRSKMPANTRRAIAALVSYGHPKVHQISYCDQVSD